MASAVSQGAVITLREVKRDDLQHATCSRPACEGVKKARLVFVYPIPRGRMHEEVAIGISPRSQCGKLCVRNPHMNGESGVNWDEDISQARRNCVNSLSAFVSFPS